MKCFLGMDGKYPDRSSMLTALPYSFRGSLLKIVFEESWKQKKFKDELRERQKITEAITCKSEPRKQCRHFLERSKSGLHIVYLRGPYQGDIYINSHLTRCNNSAGFKCCDTCRHVLQTIGCEKCQRQWLETSLHSVSCDNCNYGRMPRSERREFAQDERNEDHRAKRSIGQTVKVYRFQ